MCADSFDNIANLILIDCNSKLENWLPNLQICNDNNFHITYSASSLVQANYVQSCTLNFVQSPGHIHHDLFRCVCWKHRPRNGWMLSRKLSSNFLEQKKNSLIMLFTLRCGSHPYSGIVTVASVSAADSACMWHCRIYIDGFPARNCSYEICSHHRHMINKQWTPT